jgi:TnpA family transposase
VLHLGGTARGRITDRTFENQSYRASGLNLVIAAIVYWKLKS